MIEDIKSLINKQIESAKKWELIQKGNKNEDNVFTWKGKYDPWLLEPRWIAMRLKMTLSRLERTILDSENDELIEIWEDYKLFQKEVMMYDENFGQIRASLAEFTLKKFDKNETTKTDAIVKIDNTDTIELKVEIERLKKEVEFYKKENK